MRFRPLVLASAIALACAAQGVAAECVGFTDTSVDTATCTRSGSGSASLCSTWTDPEFDPAFPTFYYVRVLENPSCRWHRYVCNQLAVDCGTVQPTDPEYACCDPGFPGAIQERAWSSPIWYYPETAP